MEIKKQIRFISFSVNLVLLATLPILCWFYPKPFTFVQEKLVINKVKLLIQSY